MLERRYFPILQQIDMPEKIYTSALAKGQGMVQETISLLQLWEPGMSKDELIRQSLNSGILQKATALRVKDIVGRVFAKRYLIDDARPARQLKQIIERLGYISWLPQLFLVYTTRCNAILHDFICGTYWRKYAAGAAHISKTDAITFLDEAAHSGYIPEQWSESIKTRVARYIMGSLTDFGLAGPDKKGLRETLPFTISKPTLLYLVHDIHFSGYSDNSILEHADWCLFGLDKRSLLQEIERLSFDGHFIMQYAGDLLRISWKYRSMEECISALT